MNCYYHPEKQASYQCTTCKLLLCNQCIKSFQAGGFNTYFCPGCNSQCEEISVLEGKVEPAPKPKKNSEPKSETVFAKKDEPEIIPQKVQPHTPHPPPTKPEIAKPTPQKSSALEFPEEEDSGPEIQEMEVMHTAKIDLASLTPPTRKKTESAPEIQAVSAEHKMPAMLPFFSDVFLKPDKAFKNASYHLSRSVPLKLRFMIVLTVGVLASIVLKYLIDTNIFFSGFTVLTEIIIFSCIFSLGISFMTNVESQFDLGMYIASIYTIFLLFQNILAAAFQICSMTNLIIYSAIIIFFLKFWVFSRNIIKYCQCNLACGILMTLIASLAVTWGLSIIYKFVYA